MKSKLLLHQQLASLIKQHGVRGVLDAIADYMEEAAKDNRSLPLSRNQPEWPNTSLGPFELLLAADNLRNDLF